jgi:hypothetical protein
MIMVNGHAGEISRNRRLCRAPPSLARLSIFRASARLPYSVLEQPQLLSIAGRPAQLALALQVRQ